MEIKLELPMPVSINRLYINEYKWEYNPKTRRSENKPTGRRILSVDGKRVKSQIQAEARMQLEQQKDNWDYEWTKENYVYQDALIIFSRRGSDDNNIYKLLNDSLEGIIYENDSRCLVRTQKIIYNPKDPKVILTIKPVDYIGIFDNQIHLDAFESGCKLCSKYRKGSCSILKDSKVGTVREEITDLDNSECSSFKAKKK